MNTFLISQECWDLGLRAGAIVFRDVRVTDASPELRTLIEAEAQQIRHRLTSTANIRSLPELVKHHEILRSVGVKPRSHPPSTQKLLEFALKRGELPSVNNLVDAYNLVSLRTRFSLGAHDLDRIAAPIELRLFKGDESFRPLGSDTNKPVNRGEFGYVDAEHRVICRLDSLQADFSKVTEDTTNVLLIIEGTTAHKAQQLENAFDESMSMIDRFCGGTSEIAARPDWRASKPSLKTQPFSNE